MMETFDQWYDRQPLVIMDRRSEHRLTWDACEKQQVREWQLIASAPKDRRILVQSSSGEIYAAHWVQNPMDGQEAFLVSEGPDGTQHLVKPVVWREI